MPGTNTSLAEAVRLRSALAADAPALTALAHAAKRHWQYPEAWIASWADQLTVTEATFSEGPVVCAEVGDEVAGFFALSFDGDGAELEHMWVAPAFMGRGIGRALFEHALDLLRARACSRLLIASDPNAERFYLRAGAVRIGEVPASPAGRTLPLLEILLS